ncbi:hypothetical protein CDCA_CDCA11G3171 [Cyanidium caldarium]|uniref:Large ribosomal subunit protein uL15/eL18 domain-containing protein n=1 Tax=Cyanidium caldarium TaxID=2771 RepID=A0AAV9IYH5_CYACA|nr:hypothetical protein CDCA_CDCA11G3171 [Cyanidium caldarium]
MVMGLGFAGAWIAARAGGSGGRPPSRRPPLPRVGGGATAAPFTLQRRSGTLAPLGSRWLGQRMASSTDASRTPTNHSGLQMKMFDWKRRGESGALAEVLQPNTLRPAPGSRHRKKRVGRGISAGQGKSCGKGMRGQNSRSGGGVRPGFEGGQTPLYRRLPKFVGRPVGKRHKRVKYGVIKLESLNKCQEGDEVTYKSLLESKFICKLNRKLHKVLGDGELRVRNLIVKAHAFTTSAQEKIEAAGGRCVLLNPANGKELVFEQDAEEEAGEGTDNGPAEEEEEEETEGGSG